jgi:hypothetical protein
VYRVMRGLEESKETTRLQTSALPSFHLVRRGFVREDGVGFNLEGCDFLKGVAETEYTPRYAIIRCQNVLTKEMLAQP